MTRTINHTKEIIYWSRIYNDIKNIVNTCAMCLEHRNRQTQKPIIPQDIPDTPWTKVAINIFHLKGNTNLALVDYTTNSFHITQLTNKLSSTVVAHAKHFFSIFFICYLAAPWPTLGHYRGDSLTHPMLITVYYIFDLKVTRSLITRLGP